MRFSRRLQLYLLGFGIGCIFVVAIFNERLSVLTSWLPGNRVKWSISHSTWTISSVASCQLNYLNLDTAWLRMAIEESDVAFRKSDTQSNPKVYILNYSEANKDFQISIAVADSSSEFLQVEQEFSNKKMPC